MLTIPVHSRNTMNQSFPVFLGIEFDLHGNGDT